MGIHERKKMNSNTGEVKPWADIEELIDTVESKKADWFQIDKEPDKNCDVCEGEGCVGYFPNSKVIPCTCIFLTNAAWGRAVKKQRDLPKSSKDKGKDLVWRRRKAVRGE